MGNRLYVGNLAFQTTEGELQDTFGRFGTVSEVKLIMDRETGRSRGFAFVSMSSDAEAQQAINGLDGNVLDGRPLKVNVAEERRPRGDGGGYGGGGYGGGGGGGGYGGGGGGGGSRRGGGNRGNRW